MNQPIQISLRGKTVRQALDSILLNGSGYGWVLRDGIVEITNTGASCHAESLLKKVIPVFDQEGVPVQMVSTMLWLQLEVERDPSIKGFGGDFPGNSSTVKAGTLRNRTVRDILSHTVLNSQAEAWIVAGPPECLGYTPCCGLWYIVEQPSTGPSSLAVLRKIRDNL